MDRKIVERLILKKSFNDIEKDLKVGKKRIRKVHDLAKAWNESRTMSFFLPLDFSSSALENYYQSDND